MTATPTKMHLNRDHPSVLIVLMLVVAAVTVVFLARWLDEQRPSSRASSEDETLYLPGGTVRRLSLGFNGLAADWYWMRSLQYVGKKIINTPEDVVIDDLGKLDLRLLAPLLDTATTLDPQFLEPYEYAAVVLPGINVQEAIRITNKGIAANPQVWRLFQHLGYIYWQQRDYQRASETYAAGAKIQGAPPWMEAMSARMASEGGSREVAREIYGRMYEQATDDRVKEMAGRRMMQLDSLDQRDALQRVLAAYQSRTGRCPATWQEIETVLRASKWRTDASGAPLDPSGVSYLLDRDSCAAELDPASQVIQR